MTINEACPDCSTAMDTPGMFHGGGTTGTTMHTHRECPGCHRPLIWFADGPLATGWHIEETEERRHGYIAK
jgi:hypothetical protein